MMAIFQPAGPGALTLPGVVPAVITPDPGIPLME